MNDNGNRSFFEKFLKWYFIWNIIAFLCKGIAFIFKIFFIVIQQLAYIIAIGIAKILPVLKDKLSEFKNNYNTRYKLDMGEKWKEVIAYFSNLKDKLKTFVSKTKQKIPKRTVKQKQAKPKPVKQISRVKESGIILHMKKTKYVIIGFFYKYELQIIILIVIVAIIVAIALGSIFLIC